MQKEALSRTTANKVVAVLFSVLSIISTYILVQLIYGANSVDVQSQNGTTDSGLAVLIFLPFIFASSVITGMMMFVTVVAVSNVRFYNLSSLTLPQLKQLYNRVSVSAVASVILLIAVVSVYVLIPSAFENIALVTSIFGVILLGLCTIGWVIYLLVRTATLKRYIVIRNAEQKT